MFKRYSREASDILGGSDLYCHDQAEIVGNMRGGRSKTLTEERRFNAIVSLLGAGGTPDMPEHLVQAVREGACVGEISAVLEATGLLLGPAVSGYAFRPTSNSQQSRSAQS